MSSEVCPFCGKTFKRLKTHLPHCKAAAKSQTSNTTTPSSQLAAGSSEKKSTQTKKSKKVSEVSPQSLSPATAPLSPSPPSLPPSTKKKKKQQQMLSDQIKNPSPSSKPKKKSLRAMIEAAKSDHVSKELLMGTDSQSLDSKVNESRVRDKFWENNEEERHDLSENEMLWKSENSSHQARITIKDVKSMLGRAKTSRTGILEQIESSTSPVQVPAVNQKDDVSCSVTTKHQSNQLLIPGLQHKDITSKSLILLQHDGSLQSKQPLLSDHLSSQVSRATPLPYTVSMNEGLKPGCHMTSLPQFSSLHRFPLAAQTLPVRLRTTETLRLEAPGENTAGDGGSGDLNQRRLGQVRLRELPKWLDRKSTSHPRDVMEIMQRGWQLYYRRYTGVKKGGVAGLGLLLAGYCVFSYIWSN
ncbi:hypothetical protein PAMA_012225 [Pampus argenteus]